MVEITKGRLLTGEEMLELAWDRHEQRTDSAFVEAAIYHIGAAILSKLEDIDLSLTHLEAIDARLTAITGSFND